MSLTSSTASTPPRHREQHTHWGYEPYERTPPHPYGYQGNRQPPSYSRGPSGYYPPPPPQYGPPNDYYGFETPPRPYLGPPPSFESYPQPRDRTMPPPSRGPHRAPIRLSLSLEESPPTPNMIRPSSPGSFHRGLHPLPKQSDFLPPTPPRNTQDKSDKDDTERGDSSDKKKRKDSDPLSVLANVSAGMNDKDKKQQREPTREEETRIVIPMPAPTSPLQRRSKPSPITPNTASPGDMKAPRHAVTPARSFSYASSWDYGPEYGTESPPTPGKYATRRRFQVYADGSHGPPALVEQRSFESQGSYYNERSPYGAPPQHAYRHDEQPYGGYWEGPPTPYPPRYGYEQQQQWGGYPERYATPMEDPYYRGPPPPMNYSSPYTAVQQPRLEEKSILRKKFSWKHYPELERFLISNRDDYLKHSNMNYTAEQKRYNNWLTERLLEVANQHNYVFDPDEFNFVAIRDRIRCYYKSYVQTARKRGLKLPVNTKE